MVVIDVSFKQLKRLIGSRGLTLQKLEDTLFDYGFELDAHDGDDLKVEFGTDRPDCLSVEGLSRALRSYLNVSPGIPKYKIQKTNIEFIIHPELRKIRPYAAACIIKGLNFTRELIKSMIAVQEKYHATWGRDRKKAAIGIYPLSGIKPPIHFKALPPREIKFVPLEYSRELNAQEILSLHPTGQKYASLLAGFDKYPVLIDSEGNVLSMPPIINSETFGKVTEKTKDIFIEVTGTDFESVNQALTMLATMFAEEGGVIHQLKTRLGGKTFITPILTPSKWFLDLDFVNQQLGMSFTKQEVIKLLKRMGHDARVNGRNILVLVPYWRSDVYHAVDLIDDIARAYGFNNFAPEFPNTPTVGGLLDRTMFISRVRELMIGHGLLEVFTRVLTTKEDQFTRMNLKPKGFVKVLASKTPNDITRVSLIPELLKCFESNTHGEFPQRIFEVSDVVLIDPKSDVLARNETRLCVASCGSDVNYTELKQILESLGMNLGISVAFKEHEEPYLIPGRAAGVYFNKLFIGVIGEIRPEVITNFNLKLPVSFFEVNLEPLMK